MTGSKAKLFSISFAHFTNDFYMSAIPPIMFIFAKALGMNMTMQSVAAFFITAGGTMLQPFIGILLDKYGKSGYVIYTTLWIGIGMSISGLINNYYAFVAITSIAALASAVFHPLGSFMVSNLRDSSRGKSMSMFMTIGGLAFSVTPMVSLPLASNYGKEALVVLAVPAIIAAIFLKLTKVQEIDLDYHRNKKSDSGAKISLKQKLDLANVTAVSMLKGFVSSVLLVFGIKILQSKGISLINAGFILSAYLFVRTIGTLVGGYLTDKLGDHKMMIGFNALMSIFLGVFVFTSGMISAAGLLLMGFSHSASATSNVTITHNIAPGRENFGTGLILGLSATLASLIMMPFGVIADKIGLESSISIIFWVGLIPTIISIFLTNYDKSKEKEKQWA